MILDPNRECALCDELSCRAGTRLSTALGEEEIVNAVLTVSDRFAVIPSVGPLVLGHALVVTRHHSSNVLADLNHIQGAELLSVCTEYMNRTTAQIPGADGLLCFEHGSRCLTLGSLCSTNHGHLHLLPLREADAAAILRTVSGQPFAIERFQDIPELLGGFQQQYVTAFSLASSRPEINGVVLDGAGVPSQYLRRVVAAHVRVPHWDWKRDMNADLLRRTIALGFQANRHADSQPSGETAFKV